MKKLYIGAILFILGGISYASASISLSATRLIYNQKDNEVSINATNDGEQDVLIQSWLEAFDNSAPPFAITPPLAKISGKERQLLRVFYQGDGLPQDRESVLWLNVQEIPKESSSKNSIQLAILQRIKLFYRPEALSGNALSAPLNVKGYFSGGSLELSNTTPYHINLVSIQQGNNVVKAEMISPYDAVNFDVRKFKSNGVVTLRVVNDYGAARTIKGVLKSGKLCDLKFAKDD
ncbi:fimbrial biogenesis chaperone [Aeromonas hydrophila]|uniref:fimbrial biogenesis chaperone n=1 Tax=Aeromonas hydrophila TaxID=644 RepID=UPI000C78E742|nr:molecular chaperone [Aeromonas hydrophila]AWA04562.1 molecular chaperone [Aeromonas hydrophila subsp. hydrophila]